MEKIENNPVAEKQENFIRYTRNVHIRRRYTPKYRILWPGVTMNHDSILI